jgi:hypothetical protein
LYEIVFASLATALLIFSGSRDLWASQRKQPDISPTLIMSAIPSDGRTVCDSHDYFASKTAFAARPTRKGVWAPRAVHGDYEVFVIALDGRRADMKVTLTAGKTGVTLTVRKEDGF